MRQVILIPEEEGGYSVSVPSLPGCYSQGETIDEALANIKEAIEGYIEVLEEDGLPVPPETAGHIILAARPTLKASGCGEKAP